MSRGGTIAAEDIGLTATNEETLLQIGAGTNHATKAVRVGLSFDGNSNTEKPIMLRVRRQSTAGTGGTSVTPEPTDEGVRSGYTFDSSCQKGTFTAQPTAVGTPLVSQRVHPQAGIVLDLDFIIKAGGYLGITAEVPSGGAAVNATAWLEFEE